MLKGKRSAKVAFEIQAVVADAILNRIRDPRVGFVTVTGAELSQDLKHATIFISVMGDEKRRKGSLIALNYAKGFFQKVIGDQLKLRSTPNVKFILDKSIDEAMKIDAILKEIQTKDEEGTDAGDTAPDQG
jgi:ribosome-binding factor A